MGGEVREAHKRQKPSREPCLVALRRDLSIERTSRQKRKKEAHAAASRRPTHRHDPPSTIPPSDPTHHLPALKDVGRVQATLVEDLMRERGEKVSNSGAEGGGIHCFVLGVLFALVNARLCERGVCRWHLSG